MSGEPSCFSVATKPSLPGTGWCRQSNRLQLINFLEANALPATLQADAARGRRPVSALAALPGRVDQSRAWKTVQRSRPGYRSKLDGDGDGIACK
ncbi:excalibur calcium-binding domain-containing protein [Deinococcus alpinitundrae]|uniref:excalibur calcium-binding domain-containing protein n=1 Tax=Deinococcus alpinitundrae TaxID=468913 RepID=UPI0034D266B0